MRGRRLERIGVVLLVVLASAGLLQSTATAGPRSTVVSLTFDDGDADQLAAVQLLSQYQLHGTFYVISGAVGTPGYLTRAQLRQVAAGGNEIGGHTVSHLDLTMVPGAEAQRQICISRATLTDWGYRVTSFAYPDGSYTPAVEAIVKECGYDNARAAAGLRTTGCDDCATAEQQPPADPYAIRTPSQVDTTWTLQTLQQTVLAAQQNGGGWVPLVFHHVCATEHGCGDLSVSRATFEAFLAWLAGQSNAGISVRTVDQVVGGAVNPVASWSPAPAHGVVNGSLAVVGSSGGVNATNETAAASSDVPQCWMEGGYGTNTTRWSRVAGVRPGQFGERLTVTSYTSGDAKLLPQFDLGNCSIPVKPGDSYKLSTYYQSSIRTQFDVYYRDPDGRWVYWMSSPYFTPTGTWTDAVWQTPAIPKGASGLSFGLALSAVGSLTTADYRMVSTALPPPARPPILTLLTVPFLAAAVILLGVYLLAVRRSRRRRRHIARAARDDESRMSSSKR